MGDIAKDAKIRHGSSHKPLYIPYNGDVDAPFNVDRVQGVSDGWTIPAEKKYELGRKLKTFTDKGIPDVTSSLTQLEYGEIAFWNRLANKPANTTKLELSDFDDAKGDLVTVEDEEHAGDLVYCKHLAKMSLAGFTINVPDADSAIERVIDLGGDKRFVWKDNNKSFIFKRILYANLTLGTGGIGVTDALDPVPVADPDTTKYIYRVLKVTSGGVTSELELTTDYTYSEGTKKITILVPAVGDIYKVYYTATTWGTGGTPVATNDTDDYRVKPEQCDFLLIETETGGDSYKVHKLNSASIAATLERRMEGELGSDEKTIRDVTSRAVTITLGSFVTDGSFDELMIGKAGENYGKIDIEKFVSTLKFVIKIYTDKTKQSLKLGYSVANLEYNTGGDEATANDLSSKDITLESDNVIITTEEGQL